MAEHAAEYEWRGEGDEAEIVLYAPDTVAFERALPAASLPGVESPVYAAASQSGFGWAAASTTHVAPDLLSAPLRGLLLVAGTRSENLGVGPRELVNRMLRDLPEAGSRLPSLNEAGVGRLCESGAREAEDLLAALYATANFADARAARTVWMLRRLLGDATGGLDIRAAWRVGGVEKRDGLLVHRMGLATAEGSGVLVSGSYAAAGTGNMWSSAPPFGVLEDEGVWPWEEAGLLERLAAFDPPEG